MRTEEAAETGKLGVESGGKGMRSQVGGFAGESTETGVAYRDTMDARIEAVDRVNFTDLKGQGSGKMHVLFEDKVVRAKSFYANPEGAVDKRKLRLRTNHFIKVAKQDAEAMENANRMPERSEEHTSELQSLMRNSYAGVCLT